MFDFENLDVYKKSLAFTDFILEFLRQNDIDLFLKDQLKRAVISITINIAEGAGRFSPHDKRHFYIIANGSAFESIALLQIINLRYKIDPDMYSKTYNQTEEIVKMLHGLIRNLK
jgi:four helix bundle protein